MRFLASWWEQFPVRAVVPAALLFLGGFGVTAHIGGFIHHIAGPIGMLWG